MQINRYFVDMESVAEIKSGLHHYIAETDDVKTLSKIKKYVAELLKKENKIIAYTSDGRALNQAKYKADLDRAIEDANKGETISIEEMEKGLSTLTLQNQESLNRGHRYGFWVV